MHVCWRRQFKKLIGGLAFLEFRVPTDFENVVFL